MPISASGHVRHQPGGGPRLGGVPLQALGEAAALDQPHAQVQQPVALADLVDRHDVRVLQPRDHLRLVAEALRVGRIGPAVAAQ